MLVGVIFWVWYMVFECLDVVQGKLVIIATKSKEGNICGFKRIALFKKVKKIAFKIAIRD